MKTTLKQVNVAVGCLAGLVSSLALLGCGGGGGTPPPQGLRFTLNKAEDGTLVSVFDRDTGITWAGQLGTLGQPRDAVLPFASELLSVADLNTAEIDDYFPFIKGKIIATEESPTFFPSHNWGVDFGGDVDLYGNFKLYPSAESDQKYQQWMIIKRSYAPSTPVFTLNQTNGFVLQNNGLVWKLCSEGSNFQSGSCNSTPKRVRFDEIQSILDAANKGITNPNYKWRLPKKQELFSLLQLKNNLSAVNPILPSAFDADAVGLTGDLSYWTDSFSDVTDPTDLQKNKKLRKDFWMVNFSGNGIEGGIFSFPLCFYDQEGNCPLTSTDQAYVRLVR